MTQRSNPGDPYRDWACPHRLGKSYDGLDDVHEMPPPPIVPKNRIPREAEVTAAPILWFIAVAVCAVLAAMGIVSLAFQVTA
jgi:hypothetical protein